MSPWQRCNMQRTPARTQRGRVPTRGSQTWVGIVLLALASWLAVCGCGPGKPSSSSLASSTNVSTSGPVLGELIGSNLTTNLEGISATASARTSAPAPAAMLSTGSLLPPAGMTNGVLSLGFETLAAFPYVVRLEYPDGPDGRAVMATDDQLPDAIRALDGRKVAIAGYVMPLRTQARGVTEFLLVRDLLSCCFGANPQMNHWIHVSMPRGEFRPVISRPATVRGILRVGELRKDGIIHSIYRLEAEKVEMSAETPVKTAG